MVNQVGRQTAAVEHTVSSISKSKMKEPVEKTEQKARNEKKHNEKTLPVVEAEEMVESMNKFLKSADSRLKFVLHDELETYYVTIIDKETDEIIREIPSETLMNIRAAMKEFVGLLVDQKI